MQNLRRIDITFNLLTENIALNKEAWQSSGMYRTLNGSFRYYRGAVYAVDGLKENLEGEQCAVSFIGPTAEWRVDLGGILSIHHIYIQYAVENRKPGMVYINECIL